MAPSGFLKQAQAVLHSLTPPATFPVSAASLTSAHLRTPPSTTHPAILPHHPSQLTPPCVAVISPPPQTVLCSSPKWCPCLAAAIRPAAPAHLNLYSPPLQTGVRALLP
mmetsp:Transcript_16017/g.27588  ORF Transcript_16017/g.27588 Transcript_16017/m.27588 type:complete len:109 (-) Transcript_16017:115-441(-)